ncbi:MAG: hypothetical protein DKT66_20135 [Candidatus Melainabacteria bacterium]|nr:MAG: hypothetical protein DKT66_20135 [Candidatus Melainabacteria bacterium]
MWLFQKNLDDIDEDDLNQLIAEQTVESVHLDFKQVPPGTTDPEKEEFRLDVCSMANGSGGLIIYGAAESGGGFITSLTGIPNAEVEDTTLRMTQVLRAGIEPNLIGVKLHPVKLSNGNSLIALKVLRSFNMPHRVVKSRRFVIRHGAGKIDMSIEEIRAAVLFSSSYTDKINEWINERIKSALIKNPLDGSLYIDAKRLMIFVVPLSSLDDGNSLDVEAIAMQVPYFQPIGSSENTGRFVAEGFLTHRGTFGDNGQLLDYAKVYRSGRIEAIDQNQIEERTEFTQVGLEKTIIKAVKGYLLGLKALDVPPPIFIKVVLNGVSGYSFSSEALAWETGSNGEKILENHLPLPAVWVREWSEADDIPILLKSVFDALWNSAGWKGSPNYQNGIYKPLQK